MTVYDGLVTENFYGNNYNVTFYLIEWPTKEPTGQPSSSPSGQPSGQPSGHPSSQPTSQPSGRPTSRPLGHPSGQPSSEPTGQPSGQPTSQPTGQPSSSPSGQPSGQPTSQPSTALASVIIGQNLVFNSNHTDCYSYAIDKDQNVNNIGLFIPPDVVVGTNCDFKHVFDVTGDIIINGTLRATYEIDIHTHGTIIIGSNAVIYAQKMIKLISAYNNIIIDIGATVAAVSYTHLTLPTKA